jgi:FAD synthetase
MKRVMIFGTFDILHPGHIFFLRQAKKYGDYLIVCLSRRDTVKKIKGHFPHHTEADRRMLLKAIKYADRVVFGSKKNYLYQILLQKPQIIVLGYDQKHYTQGLKEKLAKRGLKVKIVRAKAYFPKVFKTSILRGRRPRSKLSI